MKRIFRGILIGHSVIAGGFGLYFYFAPVAAAALWPWALPALAAQFVGALLLGAAICTALTAWNSRPDSSRGISIMGIGAAVLGSTGLIYGVTTGTGFDAKLIVWLVIFLGTAAILSIAALRVTQGWSVSSTGSPISRMVRGYLRLHLVVVALVGATMFVLPVQAQPWWPWMMSIENVRLIGSFFVSAAFYSWWCLRQGTWAAIQPTMAFYAVFACAALLASLDHFSLFNQARVVTWIFVALYAFVGLRACYFLWIYRSRAM